MAKVKNINGTSDTNCKCGSWLKHWGKFSGQTTTICCEIKCIGIDLIGAHVQKANFSDNNWYIIPLCKTHNRRSGEIEISEIYKLVSANKKETCE